MSKKLCIGLNCLCGKNFGDAFCVPSYRTQNTRSGQFQCINDDVAVVPENEKYGKTASRIGTIKVIQELL